MCVGLKLFEVARIASSLKDPRTRHKSNRSFSSCGLRQATEYVRILTLNVISARKEEMTFCKCIVEQA
jgi:hypothetical protein